MDIVELFESKTKHQFIYNICHMNNLDSILRHGILCYNDIQGFSHHSIANISVQNRREKKIVPNGLKLHSYANCYLNPRNAMLYYIKKQSLQSLNSVVVLAVSDEVLKEDGVVISDRNAAVDPAGFYPPEMALMNFDFKKIYARYWNSGDLKQISQAEVLVPYKIEREYIKKIYVANEMARDFCVSRVGNKIPIEIDTDMFFEGV